MKKIIGFLVIGLLILTVVPVSSSYVQETIGKEKNTESITLSGNYLGKITALHNVMGYKAKFEDTSDRDFDFPVVDGKIYLNFTVTGCHKLNELAHGFKDGIQHSTRWICEVRSNYETVLAFGSTKSLCEDWYEPNCSDFLVNYTPVELKLNKGESKELWVGFGVWQLYQIFYGNIIPGILIYPRNEWYNLWNLLYPGICFKITVHGV